MNLQAATHTRSLARRLVEAEETIKALLSGQIDAIVEASGDTPILLAKAQQALRASEEQYRQIVETTTDGIIKLDIEERMVFVNRRFAEMLGYEPADIVGKSVFAVMSAAATALMTEAVLRRSAGAKDALDTTLRHKDGSEIAVNIVVSSMIDGDGQHVGNLGVVRDVTERRKLQAQLMVSDRMASVGTLAAGVAHEINNPLAAVIANIDFVIEGVARAVGEHGCPGTAERNEAWLRSEIKEPLADARDAAERVRLIVRDLKIFSRSPVEEPRGPVDVKMVMESSLRMAWNEIRHRAHLVKFYGAVPDVAVNEARLGQVFLNLIVNAAQSLQEGRAEENEIRVSTYPSGQQVIIEVSDTGAGIPPEIIGRIFDAFFTTKEVGVGTGLGLAICHRIVTDMGGELTVESEVGMGSTFRVALPIARDKMVGAADSVEETSSGRRRGRILVVDDEELVLRVVERGLSKEHEVVTVTNGRQALALCAGGAKFDVILCDLIMPHMTGMDLHRELSRIAPELTDRMVFLTGGAFTTKARQFLLDVAREHVEKPFELTSLRALVRRYVA
jgi:PAS domain S-box-containing protein